MAKLAAIHADQSNSITQLLSHCKQFYARYKMASLQKIKRHGDQTTFHYLLFKPRLDPPSDSLDTRFKSHVLGKNVSFLCVNNTYVRGYSWI